MVDENRKDLEGYSVPPHDGRRASAELVVVAGLVAVAAESAAEFPD